MSMKQTFLTTALALATSFVVVSSTSAQEAAKAISAASTKAAASVSPDALARAQQKFAAAMAITDHFSAEANAQGLDSSWRMALIINLMKGSQSDFARVASAPSLSEARLAALEVAAAGAPTGKAASSGAQPKVLGDATDDLTFVPLNPPCRIVDTRNIGGGGPFSAGEKRTYYFSPGTGAYGNPACSPNPLFSIPSDISPAAMAVNVTIVSTGLGLSSTLGYLSIVPNGSPTNVTSFMNYNDNEIIANAGVVTLNPTSGEFDVYAQIPTQLVVDYYGSFAAPADTALTCSLVVGTAENLPANTNALYYTDAVCPAATTALSAYCWNANANLVSSGGSGIGAGGTKAFCQWINADSVAHTVNEGAFCCGVAVSGH